MVSCSRHTLPVQPCLLAQCSCAGFQRTNTCVYICACVLRAVVHASVSCCRYVLAYIESYKGVKAGDRVWQLGFGSGFKVNSAVWVAKRRNNVS